MPDRKKVAFLACKHNLTTSPDRWPDAFEHDVELEAFSPAFAAAGMDLVEVDWEQVDPSAAGFDLYFVRTTWNYKEVPDAFTSFLNRAAECAPVANDPRTILWNMNKRYLGELESHGLSVIPSAFVDKPGTSIDDLRHALGAQEIVLKPLYGGGGFDMRRIGADEPGDDSVADTHFAQPFVTGILDQGELSFVFVEEDFSHALRKRPADGNYLIHTHHGGTDEAYHPSLVEIDACRSFLDVMPVPGLATRIDVVPHQGKLLLMELEAIEAHLFPAYNPRLGDMLAAACRRLLG
ncbi:MAG: RimK family alpha-L-glutamate ligase [Candidatus Phaeomarinobacter sp.]